MKLQPSIFHLPVKLYMGNGRRNDIGIIAQEYGRKVMFVVDPFLKQEGTVDALLAILEKTGHQTTIFDNVSPNPTSDIVAACVEKCRDKNIAVVIGMGGGSVMDVAKISAALVRSNGDFWDFKKDPQPIPHRPPLVLLPTTAGTGSEVSPYAVIEDRKTGLKTSIASPALYANAAIVDPELTYKMPPRLTAVSGIDALIHAVENYISTQASPISDMFALESIRLNAEHLVRAYTQGDDTVARDQMMMASLMAGISNALTGCAAAHYMSHPLAHLFHIDHGIGVGMLMPSVMTAMMPACIDRFARIADLFGADPSLSKEDKARLAPTSIINHREKVGFPLGISEISAIREGDLPKMAVTIVDHPGKYRNPKQLNLNDCIEIYKRVL